MPAPGTRAVVHPEDAHRADDVLQAWSHMEAGAPGAMLVLRGLLVAAFADCRTDAYSDGVADGLEH